MKSKADGRAFSENGRLMSTRVEVWHALNLSGIEAS